MNCPKCGTSLADNALFCGLCGAPVQQATPISSDTLAPPIKQRNPKHIVAIFIIAIAAALLGVGIFLGITHMHRGPVYAITLDDANTHFVDGSTSHKTYTYELDKHGDIVQTIFSEEYSDSPNSLTEITTYTYDKYGYATSVTRNTDYTSFGGDIESYTYNFQNEYDDNNRLITSSVSAGREIIIAHYSYYEDTLNISRIDYDLPEDAGYSSPVLGFFDVVQFQFETSIDDTLSIDGGSFINYSRDGKVLSYSSPEGETFVAPTDAFGMDRASRSGQTFVDNSQPNREITYAFNENGLLARRIDNYNVAGQNIYNRTSKVQVIKYQVISSPSRAVETFCRLEYPLSYRRN